MMHVRARTKVRVLGSIAVLSLGAGLLAATLSAPAEAVKSRSATLAVEPGDCGPATLVKADGTPWVCTFGDEFLGTSLDSTKWMPQTTAETGFSNGKTACYTDSATNIAVGGGTLKLTQKRAAWASTCKAGRSSFSTRYTSGSVMTYSKFTQTYGRFEMRAKFATTKQPGLQSAFWMYPEVTDAIWPINGEIDIAEWYSKYSDRVIPFLHYQYSFLDPNATNNNCKVANVGGAWHTYAVEWTPTYISFIYDGEPCMTNTVAAGKYPFDKAYMLALTQLVGTGTNAPNWFTPSTGTMTVDYVRGWA